MKTSFTLLSGLMISLAVAAHPTDFLHKNKSMLTIRTEEIGDIVVVVDGLRFNPNRNMMAIRNLDAGHHNIKIYRQRNFGFFDLFRARYDVIFNRPVFVRPKTNMVISIDHHGRITIDQFRIQDRGRKNGWDRGRGFDMNDRDFDRNRDWDDDFSDFDLDFERDGHHGNFDDYNGYDNSYNKAISDLEFNQVLQAIDKEWFEGNKVKSATQIIANNYMTSIQVKQMLGLFAFEDNKLNLAKQAYSKVVDKRNFLIIVGPVFSFQSSKDELARFVRGYH